MGSGLWHNCAERPVDPSLVLVLLAFSRIKKNDSKIWLTSLFYNFEKNEEVKSRCLWLWIRMITVTLVKHILTIVSLLPIGRKAQRIGIVFVQWGLWVGWHAGHLLSLMCQWLWVWLFAWVFGYFWWKVQWFKFVDWNWKKVKMRNLFYW